MQKIGVLAIQGGFAKHYQRLIELETTAVLVKTRADLSCVDKLIIPGGESTTLRILIKREEVQGSE